MTKRQIYSCMLVLTLGAILLASNAMAVTPRLHREIMLHKNMIRDEQSKQQDVRTLGADKHLANVISEKEIPAAQAKLSADMKEFGAESPQAKEDRETLQKAEQTLKAIQANEKVERQGIGHDDK